YTSPEVGLSSLSNSFKKVDLPDPEGPIRKTNSPLSMCTVTSSSAGRVDVRYDLETFSRRITRTECNGPDTIAPVRPEAVAAPGPPLRWSGRRSATDSV